MLRNLYEAITAYIIRLIIILLSISGVQPFKLYQIMDQCCTWSKLTAEQQKRVLTAIPELASAATRSGIITD
jgi:hypothetical protein